MRHMTISRAALPALLCAALATGCFSLDRDGDGFIDVPPQYDYETDYISCNNGRDDDLDGRTDCEDEDCLMAGVCGEYIPNTDEPYPEDTFESCSDGIDNDDDGTFDCGDRGCQSIRELCCLAEFDDESCSDGQDNDGNGFADCADFSCRNGPFVTVCEMETSCTDRIDNDGDRLTDCNDSDCADEPMCAESNCADGIDNDGDELVDCADPSCLGTPACPAEADCGNNVDDDGDGATDCADSDCAGRPGCVTPENTAELCSDGISNDGDNFADCADFDCAEFCEAEDTLEACMDGVDNDGNGFIDCNDFSCSRSTLQPVIDYCLSISEQGFARCTDGVDNDDNGFIDCDDNNCRFSSDLAVREVCEATFATCSDRRDNNRNGFVDCADFSCQYLSVTTTGRCSESGACPAGQGCFRDSCLSFESPCQEGADIGGNLTLFGSALPPDLLVEERRRLIVAQCTDGVDNDADGFADCNDWDCVFNPLAVNAEGNPICRSAGGRTCLVGPNAGGRCATDADCGGAPRSCDLAGPPGAVLVCP